MRFSKGFTLVELIIVIAVIGVLSGVLIGVLNPNKQLMKSRDAGRKTALKTLQNALEQYYTDVGSYPTISCFSNTSTCWNLGTGSFLNPPGNPVTSKATSYIKTMPVDPKQFGTGCANTTHWGYYYAAGAGGTSYTLVARLENNTDPQAQGGTVGTCNFGGGNAVMYSVTNQQ